MKRNFVLALLIVALMATCLVSCGSECEHTFSDKWYSDADNHWHPATCEHAETQKKGLAPHSDADQDGICDVCEYSLGHQHTFEAAWQITDTHHWHNPTCSHDEKGSYSTHSDDDMNGECDVCSGHVHNVNAAGYCEGCGLKAKEIDETSLDELVAAVVCQKYLISGGNVEYNYIGRSNTGADFESTKDMVIDFTYGKNDYTHVFVTTDTVTGGNATHGTFESWHQLDGVDRVFGVVSENGGKQMLDLPETNRLNGYHIDLSTLAGDYGVEATLYALYEAAIADTCESLEVIPDAAENKVVFKYSYKTFIINASDIVIGDLAGSTVYNVNHYDVVVEFKYTDDYALTSLDISVDCYTNEPGTADGVGFLYLDVDLLYNEETGEVTFVEYVQDENGVWVAIPTDKRTPDTYTIHVDQTVGERTEENPYPKSKFVPTGFDVFATKESTYDEDGLESGYTLTDKITGNLFVPVGDIVNIYIGNCTPANTSLHFVADQVTFKLYKDGVEVENPTDYLNQTAVAMFTFSGDLRSFFVVPKVDGAYKLEIYLVGSLVKTVNIIAGAVDEEHIELKSNEFAVKVTETYEWANEYTFTATKTGTYYFNLPAGVGFINADAYDAALETPATDDGPNPYFDYNNAKNPDGTYNPGSFSIQLNEGDTIRFYVNAVKKGTYVIVWAAI